MGPDWVRPWIKEYTTEKWGDIYMIFKGDLHVGFWACQCTPWCQEIVHDNHYKGEKNV